MSEYRYDSTEHKHIHPLLLPILEAKLAQFLGSRNHDFDIGYDNGSAAG
jgi:hypothetical protein